MSEHCIVITTTYTQEEAIKLTKKLLDKSLVACVQESEIASSYIWEGKLETNFEYKLELKSRQDKIEEIIDFIKENHSY